VNDSGDISRRANDAVYRCRADALRLNRRQLPPQAQQGFAFIQQRHETWRFIRLAALEPTEKTDIACDKHCCDQCDARQPDDGGNL